MNVDRINPGGVVDVRGIGFEYEEFVTLLLVGGGRESAVGEVTTDLAGEFKFTVVIPAESVEGSYYVLAKTAHHETTSVPFTIAGNALTETDQGRSREDGLLVAATAPGEPQLIPSSRPRPSPSHRRCAGNHRSGLNRRPPPEASNKRTRLHLLNET